MTSSKEDDTAAAAEQLGSISLGKSVERKDNEAAAEENGTTPTKLCSTCGNKSDALKKCNGCKCIWYCDKECQNKHRKEHKKDCTRIKKELEKRGGKLNLGTEMDVGPLGKVPPREECPICMHLLPMHSMLVAYAHCCGKMICCGCMFQHQMKNCELAVKRGQTQVLHTCAFCRDPVSKYDEEIVARLKKRVELKDPQALVDMALAYGDGNLGLPVDQAKCIDLLRESADLGFPSALCQLGNFFDNGEMGLEQNTKEALKYWEKAAESGDVPSRHNLGCAEDKSGVYVAAMRHWRLSASAGHSFSMVSLISAFEHSLLHHADLAETLQAFYRARGEMKSEDRDQWIKHLKRTGQYREEYEK